MTGVIEVIDGGPLTTVQDAGRIGLAHLGVSPSGFLDAPAAKLANRLVGNDETSAVLETTGRGPRLRLLEVDDRESVAVVAVTGAPASIHIDGRLADPHAPLHLHIGEELRIGQPTAGVRGYLAIRGGFEVAPVLGSRSTDLLSHLGPPPLAAGQRLPYGRPTGRVPSSESLSGSGIKAEPTLEVYPGPSREWFRRDAMTTLVQTTWTVTPASSRVGLRLNGRVLRRSDRELRPEGMVMGSIQVPPDGQPVLLLADHPTTGGYPVIAVVRARDLPHAAQAAPGTTLRFRLVGNPR